MPRRKVSGRIELKEKGVVQRPRPAQSFRFLAFSFGPS
jgi:hypothetical protein